MSGELKKAHILLCWSLDPKEDHLADRYVSIFNPILSTNDLESLKSELLEYLKLRKYDFHLCRSSLVDFCLPQVYHFTKFSSWIYLKYFSARREVWSNDDSTMLSKISPESIRKMLNIPKSQSKDIFPLSEENMISVSQQLSLELKNMFLSKFIKRGQEFDNQSLSFLVSKFNTKVMILNQILGLDKDKTTTEVILRFLVTMDSTDENKVPKIQVAEFLAKAMHTQLLTLNTLKHFRFQIYLIHLLLHYNQGIFPELQRPKQSISKTILSFVNRDENQGMFKFVNQIMHKVSVLLFGAQFPRVLEESKNYLQLIPQSRLGDWFLIEDYTMIRVYDFEEDPFLLTGFLPLRIYHVFH